MYAKVNTHWIAAALLCCMLSATARADTFFQPTYQDLDWYEEADRLHDWTIGRDPLVNGPYYLYGWGERPPASWTITAQGSGYRYELFIPNEYREDWTKRLWVQVIARGSNGTLVGPEKEENRFASPSDRCKWTLDGMTVDAHEDERRITQQWSITFQPDHEKLIWETTKELRVERVAVAIVCVPEPATLALTALGTLALLRRRRG